MFHPSYGRRAIAFHLKAGKIVSAIALSNKPSKIGYLSPQAIALTSYKL
ncbi:hypothetical protein [Calothrix sp. PCC 6303]|nr:hypothetical protein [Calothrix sp. PCC 6303]